MTHQENNRLITALSVIHDHLHHDRINDAHAVVERALSGGSAATGNITGQEVVSVTKFIAEFNAMCDRYKFKAACVIDVPSVTKPRYSSLQVGGCVPVVQFLDRAIGGASTTCVGDHPKAKKQHPLRRRA